MLAVAGEPEGDARAEHAALAGERLDHVVGEFVHGVADVAGAVALRQHGGVTARDDIDAPLQAPARGLHLDDRLRADLRPERRRDVEPLVLKLGRERRLVENLEEARDIHVLGQGLGCRARRFRVAFGARHRQLEHLDATGGDPNGWEVLVAVRRLGPGRGWRDKRRREQRGRQSPQDFSHATLIPWMLEGGGGTLRVVCAELTQASSTKLLPDVLTSLMSESVPSAPM